MLTNDARKRKAAFLRAPPEVLMCSPDSHTLALITHHARHHHASCNVERIFTQPKVCRQHMLEDQHPHPHQAPATQHQRRFTPTSTLGASDATPAMIYTHSHTKCQRCHTSDDPQPHEAPAMPHQQ
eukprot:365482-Chlamydomonas_euryale.AAC.15